MFKVTVGPEGPSFSVSPGEDILGAGRRQGVWLPFECGWGSCSTCKVTLLEGEVELLFPEAPALDERDRRRRRIIVCQSTPRSDLVIRPLSVSSEAPEERPTLDRIATLAAVEELGPNIRRFTFEADQPVAYRPGQHAIVELRSGLKRCYSMAAVPAGTRVQFVAKRYGDRPGSSALFELLLSQRVQITIPFGDMWIRDSALPIVLIAGGTGISAILALAAQLAAGADARPVRVFYGAATRPELVLAEELEGHVEAVADGKLWVVLESPPPGWSDSRGYVTDALEAHLQAGFDAHYYLAGPPPMVDATLALLRRLEVPVDRIHYDRFG